MSATRLTALVAMKRRRLRRMSCHSWVGQWILIPASFMWIPSSVVVDGGVLMKRCGNMLATHCKASCTLLSKVPTVGRWNKESMAHKVTSKAPSTWKGNLYSLSSTRMKTNSMSLRTRTSPGSRSAAQSQWMMEARNRPGTGKSPWRHLVWQFNGRFSSQGIQNHSSSSAEDCTSIHSSDPVGTV